MICVRYMINDSVHKLSLFLFLIGLSVQAIAHNQQNTYGPIKTGERIWEIAQKTRPHPSISPYQMMFALLHANPQAFKIPCNINSLKGGVSLHLPSLTDIQSVSPQEAQRLYEQQGQEWKTYRRTRQKIECPTVSPPIPPPLQQSKTVIKIGVLAKRGKDNAVEMWQPTADYLSNEIAGYKFVIVPLSFEQIYSAIGRGEVDFVIANPGMYVEFESFYGTTRIATLKNLRLGGAYTTFGGVIFRKSSRTEIRSLEDFKDKVFMGVDETSLGGWQAAWREFEAVGINPYRDFKQLRFAGTHDEVVYAVRDGLVDGGTVRTDTLESMASEGKINLFDFTIINQQKYTKEFPLFLSTALYPEWPFAAVKHTSETLAKEVVVALLKMPEEGKAAQASRSKGWTIPLSYEPVHECFKELHVGPYKDFGKITLRDLFDRYLYWTFSILFSFFCLGITTMYFQRRALVQSQKVQKVLRTSEAQSRNYAYQLEIAVADRTAELKAANEEITALYERIKIENLRMSAELEVTHRLQEMILPKEHELQCIDDLEIVAFMQPAHEVGGDYYDVLAKGSGVRIAIGDVTGHGLESGVLSIMVQTAFKTLSDSEQTDHEKILDILNRVIYDNVQRMNCDKTLSFLLMDYEAGTLHVSGQHEEVIVVRRGEVERVNTLYLGFPIGLERDIRAFLSASMEIKLNPGDVVVLYTDGITEAQNTRKEFYGLNRLCERLSQHWQKTAKDICKIIIADVQQHIGSYKVFDDITLLVLKQK